MIGKLKRDSNILRDDLRSKNKKSEEHKVKKWKLNDMKGLDTKTRKANVDRLYIPRSSGGGAYFNSNGPSRPPPSG